MDVIEYTIDRFDDVMALMLGIPGISVRTADSREATELYLLRNPGLNFLAVDDGKVIGCAMCGHDGRRGYLQHVVVAVSFRGRGVANTLVEQCLSALKQLGIMKVHLDVFVTNEVANAYWRRRGWKLREDINRYSLIMSEDGNA